MFCVAFCPGGDVPPQLLGASFPDYSCGPVGQFFIKKIYFSNIEFVFSILIQDYPRPSPGKGREALLFSTAFSVYHDFLGTNLIEGVIRNNKSNVISVIN